MNSEERQKLIREASQAYYTDGTSPLTDAEFDALLEEERKENPNSPLLEVGHGFDVSKTSGEKFPHKYGIVGSLPKCHNWEEFPKALKQTNICSTLKLDGLSCAMYYRDGVMYQALTRGNGTLGIDITDKIRRIVPDYIIISDSTFTGAVRGEILMSLDSFEKYSATHEDAKNPRNTTAGLINAKELSDDLQYLTVVVYTVIGVESTNSYPFPLYPFSDYNSMNKWLHENFSNIVKMEVNFYNNATEFDNSMNLYREVWYEDYPADGIVIASNEIEFVKTDNGTSIQYNSSAFKFKAETAETTITGIEWNLSKTKYLIPVIQVEPVQLSGATVRRCSGCNAKMVRDNYWGTGAVVKMTRSGEVIPYIEQTVVAATPDFPIVCPSCGTCLIWEGVHLKCPNPDCKDMQLQDLLVWCNNIAPTDGLGDTLKIKFFEEFGIKSIEDIYSREAILKRLLIREEGTQKALFCSMIDKLTIISDTPNISLVSALKALNIPRLGDATADLLSHYPDDITELINGEVPYNLAFKIGNANSESIIKHIDKFKRLDYIKSNLDFSVKSSNNSGIKVAITGSLSSGLSRKEFEKILNEHGFVLGDMTKDTKYLITDTPNSGSSKNAKADKLGIEKITEADFRARYNIGDNN